MFVEINAGELEGSTCLRCTRNLGASKLAPHVLGSLGSRLAPLQLPCSVLQYCKHPSAAPTVHGQTPRGAASFH